MPPISSAISRASAVLWLLTVPMSLFAIVYGALLLRGPFDSLTAG